MNDCLCACSGSSKPIRVVGAQHAVAGHDEDDDKPPITTCSTMLDGKEKHDPEVDHTGVPFYWKEAFAIMRMWGDSETWRASAMSSNEWTMLPLPVLDLVVQALYDFPDLRNMGLVCKMWHVAVTQKIPFSREIFAENMRWKKEMREDIHRNRIDCRQLELQHFMDALFGFALLSIPTLVCLVVGLTGLIYFVSFVKSVSIVPDCVYAYSMITSLYCCCSFCLLGVFPSFVVSLISCYPYHHRFGVKVKQVLNSDQCGVWCCRIGIVASMGTWSSAAACIHFCNVCVMVNPHVSAAMRAFAITSLVVGLIANILLVVVHCALVDSW